MNRERLCDFTNTTIAFSYLTKRQLRKRVFLLWFIRWKFLFLLARRLVLLIFKLRLPMKTIIRATLFEQFCGGETLEETSIILRKLKNYGVGVSLDYVVEGSNGSQGSLESIFNQIILSIDYVANLRERNFVVLKMSAFLKEDELKLLGSKSEQLSTNILQVKNYIYKICEHAEKNRVSLLVDAEQSWVQSGIDDFTEELIEKFNKEIAVIYHTVQMYRKDRMGYLKKTIKRAKTNSIRLGIKLVRGAYLEAETLRAQDEGCGSPLCSSKEETDRNFDEGLKYCLDNLSVVSVFLGTHNIKSIKLMMAVMEKKGLKKNNEHCVFAQLFGMGDHITFNLAKSKYHAYKYVPYGPIEEAVPYLLRRAEENSAMIDNVNNEIELIKKELGGRS